MDLITSEDIMDNPDLLNSLQTPALSATNYLEMQDLCHHLLEDGATQALASEYNYASSERAGGQHPEIMTSDDVLLSCGSSLNTWDEQNVTPGDLVNQGDDSWVDELLNPLESKDADLPQSAADQPGTISNMPASSSSSVSPPCSEPDDVVDVRSPDSTRPSSSSKTSRKRKASGSSTADDAGNAACGSKNAVAARENRLKKKKYVEDLEQRNQELEEENRLVQDKSTNQEERIRELEERTAYLENVLRNDSALSSLLGSLQPTSAVRLSVAGQGVRRKRRCGGDSEVIPMSKGVCLHVDGQTASLEFCSRCAVMAKGGSG